MISRQQAIDLYCSDDLVSIGMEADAIRRKLHPEGIVSYSIDRDIRYTNSLAEEEIHRQIQETVDIGGTGIVLHDVFQPDREIQWYEDLLHTIKDRFTVCCRGFSPLELLSIAQASRLSLRDTIARLRDAGLDSIADTHLKFSTQDWVDVQRTAHSLGLQTIAAITYEAGESIEQRMDHLDLIRQMQDETGGFIALVPGYLHSGNPSKPEVTAVEYLKMLALSRVYLEHIPNIQASWAVPGLKVCQLGFRFGSNDVGSIRDQETIVSEEKIRRLIRDAGFVPKQRDTLYCAYFIQ